MEGGSFHLWFMPAAHGGWPPLHSKDNILNLLFHSLPLHSVMPLTPICISLKVIWSVSILTSSGSKAGLRQVDSIRQPASTNAYINHAFDLQTTNHCNKPVSQPDTSFRPCLQLHLPPFNNAQNIPWHFKINWPRSSCYYHITSRQIQKRHPVECAWSSFW